MISPLKKTSQDEMSTVLVPKTANGIQASLVQAWGPQQWQDLEIGMDEVGRGCLAGPLVVGCVAWPAAWAKNQPFYSQLDDSKKLSPVRRRELARVLSQAPLHHKLLLIEPPWVDQSNVLGASLRGFSALYPLEESCSTYIDGPFAPADLPWARPVLGGDALIPVIAAAAILAKVVRDHWMSELTNKHPGYGFEHHKGYGTQAHCQALARLGPCAQHRKSFAPVRQQLRPDWPGAEGEFSQPADLPQAWRRFSTGYHRLSPSQDVLILHQLEEAGLPSRCWREGRPRQEPRGDLAPYGITLASHHPTCRVVGHSEPIPSGGFL
jgi:ribonuclease HII